MRLCLNFGFAILVVLVFPNYILFTTGSDLKPKWEVWESVPSQSQLRIFVFNLTNPDEFEEGKKPIFSEIGPYVFTESRQKVGIAHSENKSSVEFREIKTYDFLRADSIGSEDDLVTIVNIPLLTFGKILSDVPYVGANYFRSLVKSGETLTRRNERIGDVFYYGFEAGAYVKVLEALQGEEAVPEQFSGGRFGLFKGRNGTDDGVYSIGTGTSAEIPYGKILTWKNESSLKWWTEDKCNALSGVRGETFDPRALGKAHITTFDPDVCRSLKYTYHGKSKFQGSVSAWKYVLSKDLLEDPRSDPNNLCYCPKPGDRKEKCYKRGVIDLSPCREGAPLVLSYPHFFHADESYGNQIGGMHPNKTLHNSALVVEPKTGTVLQDTKRFQLNVHMKPFSSLTYLKKVPELLLPVFWSERIYTVNEEAMAVLKEEIKKHPEDEDADSEGSWEGVREKTSSEHGGNAGNGNTIDARHALVVYSFVAILKLLFQ